MDVSGVPYNGGSNNQALQEINKFISEMGKGAADAAFGIAVTDKLKTFKNGVQRIPSLGPGMEVKVVTIRPGVKALKILSKGAGPLALGTFTYDVINDYRTYDNNTDRTKAIVVTSGAFAVTVATGFVSSGIGVPVGFAIIIGAGVGYLATDAQEWMKDEWIRK